MEDPSSVCEVWWRRQFQGGIEIGERFEVLSAIAVTPSTEVKRIRAVFIRKLRIAQRVRALRDYIASSES
jgi:hypothetical protein